jgi:hypothetical protein
MGIAAAVVAAAFYLSFVWWGADARSYQTRVDFFKPPKLDLSLGDGGRLVMKVSDQQFLERVHMNEMVPDHGHLVHLFLIRTPAMDRIWHLHPDQLPGGGEFVQDLPPLDAGHYSAFADLVHKTGFPFTMVGEIDLPQIPGKPPTGDDAGASVPPIGGNPGTTFTLPDGGRVVWHREAPLRANVPVFLRFEVQDSDGKPAGDLEPYMGMAAHAAIVRSDLSVFAHIHPSGTVPMASLMLASARNENAAPEQPMADMPEMQSMPSMPEMAASSMPGMAAGKVAPEISIPYGFPKPGAYRIFLQFKRRGRVETAVFDAQVQ